MRKQQKIEAPSEVQSPPSNIINPEPSLAGSDSPFDPFAPENLRLDPSYLKEPVAKKLLVNVRVGKPHKQHFIRVHPGDDYRQLAAIIELDEDRESYLVLPRLIQELGESEYFYATLFVYVTRRGTVGIWPVKVPNSEGRQNSWHTTAVTAAETAMKSGSEWSPICTKGKRHPRGRGELERPGVSRADTE
jgi:hypothetical protein